MELFTVKGSELREHCQKRLVSLSEQQEAAEKSMKTVTPEGGKHWMSLCEQIAMGKALREILFCETHKAYLRLVLPNLVDTKDFGLTPEDIERLEWSPD